VTGSTRLKYYQVQELVREGIKGKIYALSKRESGIFFVSHQQSCFFSTAVRHEVGKTGDTLPGNRFFNIILNCAVRE
jgi:hypothetical protein